MMFPHEGRESLMWAACLGKYPVVYILPQYPSYVNLLFPLLIDTQQRKCYIYHSGYCR